MTRLLIFIVLIAFSATPAHADCVDPPGVASQQTYNFDTNIMQYCNGTEWRVMAGESLNDIDPAAGPAITDSTSVNCTATILPLSLTCTATCPVGYWRSGCFATLGTATPVGTRGCFCGTPDLQCTAFCIK
jgi:hypothetical protein